MILEITYQQQLYKLPAAFQRYGFTYRITVSIKETPYIFETDEEGSYRVLKEETRDASMPDAGLLNAIAGKLQQL